MAISSEITTLPRDAYPLLAMHRAQLTLARICLVKVTRTVQTNPPPLFSLNEASHFVTYMSYTFSSRTISHVLCIVPLPVRPAHISACQHAHCNAKTTARSSRIDPTHISLELFIFRPPLYFFIISRHSSSACVYTNVSCDNYATNFAGYKRFNLVDTDEIF